MALTTRPIDVNSEIKWRYESIRTQVMAELLALPEIHLKEIERNLRRRSPELNNESIQIQTT